MYITNLQKYFDTVDYTDSALDSFTLTIPYKSVKSHSHRIGETIFEFNESEGVVYHHSGKVRNRFTPNTDTAFNDHITRAYGSYLKRNPKTEEIERHFALYINSKALRSKYQLGITNSTFMDLFNFIKEDGYADISYDALRKGVLTDVDIKIDRRIDYKRVDSFYKEIQKSLEPTRHVKKAGNIKRGIRNKGFQIGLRNGSSLTNPNIKWYSKHLELSENSRGFYDSYCDFPLNLDGKDVRMETCIRNKNMFTLLGIKDTTLGGILDDLPNVSKKAFLNAITRRLDKSVWGKKEKQEDSKVEVKEIDKDRFLIICASLKRNKSSVDDAVSIILRDKGNIIGSPKFRKKKERYIKSFKLVKEYDKVLFKKYY